MEFYHLLNRGVDKREIFLDDEDYKRFILGLDLFNDTRPVDNIHRILNGAYVRLRKSNTTALVDIHGWCLMKNHYHLLVSGRSEGGITKFIRKLNIGYSKYFNERYRRSGTLFQGRTKKIRIEKDAHFLHILNYIHFNPLDYKSGAKEWREGKITSVPEALKHIGSYKWSSYSDYCGKPNFKGITTTGTFNAIFNGYQKSASKYLTDLEVQKLKPYLLE
jgi:putative transposase